MVVSNIFIFTPTWGNDRIRRAYFQNGLKPPTRSYKYASYRCSNVTLISTFKDKDVTLDYWLDLLLMEKIQTITWDVYNLVNNGINYQPQLVSRILSINSMTVFFWEYPKWKVINLLLAKNGFTQPSRIQQPGRWINPWNPSFHREKWGGFVGIGAPE